MSFCFAEVLAAILLGEMFFLADSILGTGENSRAYC